MNTNPPCHDSDQRTCFAGTVGDDSTVYFRIMVPLGGNRRDEYPYQRRGQFDFTMQRNGLPSGTLADDYTIATPDAEYLGKIRETFCSRDRLTIGRAQSKRDGNKQLHALCAI